MATPTAPAPEQQILSPAPTAQPSTLAQLLTPVQPARPVGEQAQPLGSTSNLRQDTASDTGTTSSSGSSRDANRDGPVGALFRALASRIGRTGTTTNIKRTHAISENRTSGNSSATTNANKHDRANKHDGSTHHRDQRDAKVADLNNKTQQHHGRNTRDTKAANVREAKSGRDSKSVDTRDAKIADARDAKTTGSTSTKKDNSAKTADARDAKSASNKGDKFAKTDNSGCVVTTKPVPGGASTQAAAKGSDGNAPKTDKVDGGTTVGPDLKKTDVAAKATPGKDSTATDPKDPTKTDTTSATTPVAKEPLRTQAAREAGYRDGTRAAGAVGHVQAYRDGTRDGWDDRTAANQDDKKRMDAARAHNAAQPKTPAAPQMAPATGSTTDLTKKDAPKPADDPKPKLTVPPKPTTPPTVGTRPATAAKNPGGPNGPTPTPAKKSAPANPPQSKKPPTTTAQEAVNGEAVSPNRKPPTPTDGSTVSLTKKPDPAIPPASAPAAAPVGSGGAGRQSMTVPTPQANQPAQRIWPPAPTGFESSPSEAKNISVGADSVTFTPGGSTEPRSMSRGEVRTLRQFESRLEEKASALYRIAEDSKIAREHAVEHAKNAQDLADSAKSVKGGIALVTALHRLAEQARQLDSSATEAEKAAARGADAVKALSCNTETRHGGIYAAVADSPLTAPAEREFYLDQQGG